jgi:hypothetical protein
MRDVIIWSMSGGILIFTIGVISALEARKQNSNKLRKAAWLREQPRTVSGKDASAAAGMEMAAKGTGNPASQESLALIGAEQGRGH